MISLYKYRIILLVMTLHFYSISLSQDLGIIIEKEVVTYTNKSQEQNLDSLLKLHTQQSRELLQSRGVSIDTRSSEEKVVAKLIEELNSYSTNVGILIYAYNEGTFITILMNRSGNILTKKKSISRKELIDNVTRYCGYNSTNELNRGTALIVSDQLDLSINEIEEYLFPFKEEIKNLEHLIIVPALNISNIPFASIKMAENKYLIDLMSYSIAPGLMDVFISKRLNEKNGVNSFDSEVSYNIENGLFISNPEFNDSTEIAFNPLPGTEKEVKSITSQLKDSTFTILNGKEAKFSNFYENICTYDLLYFATHGKADPFDPLNKSYLALAMDAKGKSNLTAKDVQDIRLKCELKADLVVLSACQTGLGKEHEAGVIGLARAFHIAGSNHVVMSLWNIDDDKTAILMSLFFKHLKEPDKLMPHSAIRKAILEFKSEFENPIYWSSFSILGVPY